MAESAYLQYAVEGEKRAAIYQQGLSDVVSDKGATGDYKRLDN